MLIAGPGKGEQVDLQVEGNVDDEEVSGDILLELMQEESVAFEGDIDDGSMSLSWVYEISSGGNGPDGGTIAFSASLTQGWRKAWRKGYQKPHWRKGGASMATGSAQALEFAL